MFFLRSLVRPTASQTPLSARQSVRLVGRQSQRWQMSLNNAPRAAQYSSGGSLSKEEVQARVLDVFKGFEKVNPNKVSEIVEIDRRLKGLVLFGPSFGWLAKWLIISNS